MDTLYWLLQYFWTLIAFIFIMYIWPTVVFRKFLKGKSRTFKFSFCTVVMIAIINLVCIALGLIHCLNKAVFVILFYGTFFTVLFWKKRISRVVIHKFKNLVSGTYGRKSMFLDVFRYTKKKLKELWKRFSKAMEGRWFEYVTLGIIVIFAMIYFSYGAFHDYSFGCGDIYTHTQWTYYLTEGTIFSSGIYPEGMHFFIYGMITLFGVPLYTAMIFTGCITNFVIIISAYILFREIFKFKYTPFFALALFLLLDVDNAEMLFSMCRFQWTLPQEFGYPAMFLCTAYLIRFLRYSVVEKRKKNLSAEPKEVTTPGKKKKIRFRLPLCFKDENLFIFMVGLAVTIIIHFYATIMCFFLCVGVAVAFIHKIFSRKFLPLFTAVMMGLIISIVPFVISFMCGIRLQGSLYWAMSLFTPKATEEVEAPAEEISEDGDKSSDVNDEKTEEPEKQEDQEAAGEEGKNSTSENNSSSQDQNSNPETGMTLAASTGTGTIRLLAENAAGISKLFSLPKILHETGYNRIHGKTRGTVLFIFMIIAVVIGLGMSLVETIYIKKNKLVGVTKKSYGGYLALAFMGAMCHLFYCSGVLGIPWIMEPYRIGSLACLVGFPVILVPCDLIFDIVFKKLNEKVKSIISAGIIVGIYAVCKLAGIFHGFLLYQTTRYNSEVMVTKQIVDTMPAESFTIVSTTDELYQVMGKSYHEELIQFINESEVVSYTIPTEYIFIYVEKNPLQRNQYHFFTGPSWLAEQKYFHFYSVYGMASEGDDLLKDTINEEYANVYFGKFPPSASVYAVLWQRVLLNSKVYTWCQKFNAMYPNELHVYYEDDDFLCYYLKQNPRNLYELATMDPSVMVPADQYTKPIWPSGFKNPSAD